jgi:hypothetical protein
MKGGSFTYNYKDWTAQQILDHFSNGDSYLIRKEFKADTGFYNLITKYINNTDSLWLDNDLILSNLNYDLIESKLWNHLTSLKNTQVTLRTPVFRYLQADAASRIVEAQLVSHPYLKKDQGNNYILHIGGKSFDTGKTDWKEAFSGIIGNFNINTLDNNDKQQQLTSFTTNIPIDKLNRSKCKAKRFNENTYDETRKILYTKYTNKKKTFVGVYYIEKEGDDKYVFHPLNLLNNLPKSEDELLFKKLFTDITGLLNTNYGGGYNNLPDGFWHIHVTKIPNEDDILLTLHAKNEIVDIEEKQYKYKNNDGESNIVRIKNANLQNKNKKKGLQEKHNFFILLKKTEHSLIYSLQNKDHSTNPLIADSGFSLSESALGYPIFDINHIRTKGVIITSVKGSLCSVFCDAAEDQDKRHTELLSKENRTAAEAAAAADPCSALATSYPAYIRIKFNDKCYLLQKEGWFDEGFFSIDFNKIDSDKNLSEDEKSEWKGFFEFLETLPKVEHNTKSYTKFNDTWFETNTGFIVQGANLKKNLNTIPRKASGGKRNYKKTRKTKKQKKQERIKHVKREDIVRTKSG